MDDEDVTEEIRRLDRRLAVLGVVMGALAVAAVAALVWAVSVTW